MRTRREQPIGLKLQILAHTPHVEALIATAVLTTTSGAKPSTLFDRLLDDPKRVEGIVGRLESHHGSVLEHNRLCWLVGGSEGEVLRILLRSRFIDVSKLGDSSWLMSCNLRTAIEISEGTGDLAEFLFEYVRAVAPTLHDCLKGRSREG